MSGTDQEIKEKCISYYQQEAEGYDRFRFSCECNRLYDRLAREIVYSYLKDCKYVLDAGTGTGRFAIYLAKKGINVVGVDSSREMVAIARKKAEQAGCQQRVQFIVADIEHLPFRDGCFDGVCSITVLIHFARRNRAASEMSRVLEDGGSLVLDVPNKLLSIVYRPFLRLAGKTTFPDFHYGVAEIRRLCRDNSVKLVGRRAFAKLPRLAVHPFLCVLKLRFVGAAIAGFEKLNFGGTSIVKGLKVK